MPKVGRNIYKRSDGRWEGRYVKEYVNGRARYGSVYAHSYHDVKDKLDNAKRTIVRKHTPTVRAGRVSDISTCWLSEASSELKESSIIKYDNLLRCYIVPAFGDRELSEITNEDLINFVSDLKTCGGVKGNGLSPSTVSEIVTIMNSLRIYALKRDQTVLFTTECVFIKRQDKDIRVFSLSEENRLVRYLKEHMDLTSLGILVCLYTGIRVGELCALTWDQIDLIEKKMRIGRTMQRLRIEGKDHKTEVKIIEPKSRRSIRTIPLPDVLMEHLRPFAISEGFFLTGDKVRYIEPRVMQNRFKRILKMCGIEDANFHATRHTFATRCVELGFDIKSLSEILGHASVTITMNKYVHPSMELKAENMNKFSGLFGEKAI